MTKTKKAFSAICYIEILRVMEYNYTVIIMLHTTKIIILGGNL